MNKPPKFNLDEVEAYKVEREQMRLLRKGNVNEDDAKKPPSVQFPRYYGLGKG